MKRFKREKTLFHKLFILFIILLLPTFFIREYRLIKSKKDSRILPTEDFSIIELEPHKNKSFTFIVLTENNIDSIDQNIESILSQNYSDYKVVYIDHSSKDGTRQSIRRARKHSKKVRLIECQSDHEVYEKYYNTVLSLKDDEVVVHLYGNDWLAHEEVLQRLDQSYSNPDVWLTYGQYEENFNLERGIRDPKPKKTLYKKRVQKAPWVVAPLKTYYASLFKKLHVEAGFFISIHSENALLTPMAELAKAHVRFIPYVLYIHNGKPAQRMKKGRVAHITKSIETSVANMHHIKAADLILLSENSPEQLEVCLDSCQKNLQGLSFVHVIYECNEKSYSGYQELIAKNPAIKFTRSLGYGEANFKKALLQVLSKGIDPCPYVILSTDEVEISSQISLPMCVAVMQKTGAYGFYFHLGGGMSDGKREGIYAWNIKRSEGSFKRPDALQMSLYRRIDLEKDFKRLSFSSTHELIQGWADMLDCYRLGLSFQESRVSKASAQMLSRS